MMIYRARDWYWIVAGSTTQVFSSSRAGYVGVADAAYVAWLAAGNIPSKIADEPKLWAVLGAQYPAGLPADAAAQNAAKDFEWNQLPLGAKKMLFNHENRIRVLEGKATLTLAQFIVVYRALNSPS